MDEWDPITEAMRENVRWVEELRAAHERGLRNAQAEGEVEAFRRLASDAPDVDTMPLPLLPPSALDVRSEGDGNRAFPIRDNSRAPVIGRWALWLAIDDDGAAYAYAECPRFQPSATAGTWIPREGSRYERIDADALDMDALNRNRMPRNGNGRCFLLVEPVDRYTRPRSIFARIRRAVVGS